jgi:dihydroorotase-like cyclic amidohydrolase
MNREEQKQVVDLVVKGGNVVTPSGVITGGVAIQKGKIVSVGTEESLPPASKTIDAKGYYIMPGVIDQETHA